MISEQAQAFRSKWVDPDFRRDPKTDLYCFVCQRDIKKGFRYLGHAIMGATEVVHPDDRQIADRELPSEDNLGLLPVGSDCAKRVGLEWFVEATPADQREPRIREVQGDGDRMVQFLKDGKPLRPRQA